MKRWPLIAASAIALSGCASAANFVDDVALTAWIAANRSPEPASQVGPMMPTGSAYPPAAKNPPQTQAVPWVPPPPATAEPTFELTPSE